MPIKKWKIFLYIGDERNATSFEDVANMYGLDVLSSLIKEKTHQLGPNKTLILHYI